MEVSKEKHSIQSLQDPRQALYNAPAQSDEYASLIIVATSRLAEHSVHKQKASVFARINHRKVLAKRLLY